MASFDILRFNPFNLKSKIMKIEHKKIFRSPSKILKKISWPINICLKYFTTLTKSLRPPSYILNVQSLNEIRQIMYSLHRVKEFTENIYNNIMNSTELQNRVYTVFMSSKNSKTSDPDRL